MKDREAIKHLEVTVILPGRDQRTAKILSTCSRDACRDSKEREEKMSTQKTPEQIAAEELKREELGIGITPLSQERDSLILLQRVQRIAVSAIEADRAQREEAEWEYGTGHTADPGTGSSEPSRRAAEVRAAAWNRSTRMQTGIVLRRRKAGPWEVVE